MRHGPPCARHLSVVDSEDLGEYRRTVADALGRLGQFAVKMETFGAKPVKPLAACQDEVRGADALIVVVGHRYGWVPPKADGGDGKKSITWMEVQWALEAKKPVYAFVIDPKMPWPGTREQDWLIGAATKDETLDVWRRCGRSTDSPVRGRQHDPGVVHDARPTRPARHDEPVPLAPREGEPGPEGDSRGSDRPPSCRRTSRRRPPHRRRRPGSSNRCIGRNKCTC